MTSNLPTASAETPIPAGAPADQLAWLLPQTSQPPTSDFLTDSIQAPNNFPEDTVCAMSAMNWLSPDDAMQLDLSTLVSFPRGPDGFETLEFPFDANDDPMGQPAWPIPDEITSPGLPPVTEASEVQVPSTTPSTSSPHRDEGDLGARSAGLASSEGTFYVDGDPWRAPFKGLGRSVRRRSTRGVLSPRDETTPGTPFPGDTGTGEASSSDAPSEQALKFMLSCIRTEMPSGRTLDIPPISQLQAFFRLYFQCFHQTFPFLRRDARSYRSSPRWILLLAVCAIGSRYASDTNHVKRGVILFDALERVLRARAVEFPFESPLLPWKDIPIASSAEEPLSVLQAAVLNLIWKVHSGQESPTREVIAERHSIVAACRNMGLLSSTRPGMGKSSGDGDWAKDESRTRTGLMIWVRRFVNWVLLEMTSN